MFTVTACGAVVPGPVYDPIQQVGIDRQSIYPRGINSSGRAVGTGSYQGNASTGNGSAGDRAIAVGPAQGDAVELRGLGFNNAGRADTDAIGITEAGVAVGTSRKYIGTTEVGMRAVRWMPGSTAPVELGTLHADPNAATSAWATASSTNGYVVGYAWHPAGGVSGTRWAPTATAPEELKGLSPAGTGSGVYPADVNASGAAVGIASFAVDEFSFANRAVRWDPGSTVAIPLTSPASASVGNHDSYARDISESGHIAGLMTLPYTTANLGTRAVRWLPGQIAGIELGHLGTDAVGYTSSGSKAVNESGQVVGFANKYVAGVNKGERAVRWDAGSTVAVELPVVAESLAGVGYSNAYDINDAGFIAGRASRYNPIDGLLYWRAVVWTPAGQILDLNDWRTPGDGWDVLLLAEALSENGWVAGTGLFDPDGTGPSAAYQRTFVLQIPEPACMTLVTAVLPVLMLRRYDRAKRGDSSSDVAGE